MSDDLITTRKFVDWNWRLSVVSLHSLTLGVLSSLANPLYTARYVDEQPTTTTTMHLTTLAPRTRLVLAPTVVYRTGCNRYTTQRTGMLARRAQHIASIEITVHRACVKENKKHITCDMVDQEEMSETLYVRDDGTWGESGETDRQTDRQTHTRAQCR